MRIALRLEAERGLSLSPYHDLFGRDLPEDS